MEANIMSIHNPPRRELLLITVQSPTAFFWRFFFRERSQAYCCILPLSNRKFRTDLAFGNRADHYISAMRIQSFHASYFLL